MAIIIKTNWVIYQETGLHNQEVTFKNKSNIYYTKQKM